MGETVAYNICGKDIKYNPGIWFNSAKFLDIEYQVYGNIQAQLPESHSTLYWEHDSGKKSLRINYNTDDETVIGFNLMGIRFRHEVCDKWIRNKTKLPDVLRRLNLANFDPEFYNEIESGIIAQYKMESGQSIAPKSKRKWDEVFSFLNS